MLCLSIDLFALQDGTTMLRQYKPEYIQLLKLAMPLVLTQAGQMTVQLIDNAMVGHFGTNELAAASFTNNIYIVIMLFGLGISMGITPRASHAQGAQDERQAAATIKSGFVLYALLIPGITLCSWAIVRPADASSPVYSCSLLPFAAFDDDTSLSLPCRAGEFRHISTPSHAILLAPRKNKLLSTPAPY
jgi:hypothetical protein